MRDTQDDTDRVSRWQDGLALDDVCVFVCVWVAVAVESWSWIASVFTRPLNKAFLSVFLVFGIWDFGMVVVFFFFFLSLCIPPPPPPQVNFWFKLILPTPLPSDPQLFEIIKKKENVSTVLLSVFFFVLAAIPLSHSKVIFCHFWFMHRHASLPSLPSLC